MDRRMYDDQAYDGQAYGDQAYDGQAYDEQVYGGQAYDEPVYDAPAYGGQAYDERMDDGEPATGSGFRTAAKVFDFVGVMCCTALLLAMMALMAALFSWLRGDLNATFSGIGQNINEAVVIDAPGDP